MPGAGACEIDDSIDGQRQHRALDEIAAFGAEHGDGFGMVAVQARIDQRRQNCAAFGGDLKASFDMIARRGHMSRSSFGDRSNVVAKAAAEKKEQGMKPCSKIVSTLLPRKN